MKIHLTGKAAHEVYVKSKCPFCGRKFEWKSFDYWEEFSFTYDGEECKVPAYATLEFFCECGAHGWGDWTEERGWDIEVER